MAVSTIDPNGLNVGQLGGDRNIIINGAMTVAQRSTSETGIASNGYHTVDRWNYNDDTTGVLTMSQDTNAPDGFAYSFKSLVTTADTSIGATEQTRIEQRIESSSVQQLKYGTSDAQQLTVSFWVKTNKTGSWSVGLYMDSVNYNISQAYTVNSADTWEYKTVTFAANTAQAMTGNFRLWYTFAAGTDRTSGTSNTWGTSAANRAVGQSVNLFDATSNYWQITGVQLEIGDTATDFEHESYGTTLQKCKRYFEQFNYANTEFLTLGSTGGGTTTANGNFYYTEKRAAPTVTLPTAGQSSGNISYLTATGGYPSSTGTHTIQVPSTKQCRISAASYSGLGTGTVSQLFSTGSTSVTVDAEL